MESEKDDSKPQEKEELPKSIKSWTNENVAFFSKQSNVSPEGIKTLIDENIDGETIHNMSTEMMELIGLSSSDALTLVNAFIKFKRKLNFTAAHKKVNESPKFTKEDLVKGFKEKSFKKVVIMTGAGISVSAGIPDFRTFNFKEYDLPYPEAVFNLKYFNKKPEAFYHFA